MIFPPDEEIKAYLDLCKKHAELLIDGDYDYDQRVEEPEWPCLIKGCKRMAAASGWVRVSPPLKMVK